MGRTPVFPVVLAALALLLGLAAEPAVGAPATPAQEGLPAAPVAWRQVSAGEGHTCAITTERRLYCFGRDEAGQLGDGGDNAGGRGGQGGGYQGGRQGGSAPSSSGGRPADPIYGDEEPF